MGEERRRPAGQQLDEALFIPLAEVTGSGGTVDRALRVRRFAEIV